MHTHTNTLSYHPCVRVFKVCNQYARFGTEHVSVRSRVQAGKKASGEMVKLNLRSTPTSPL